jgi:uncharacterized protein CbrC (UPF0167 family)
VQDDSQHSFRYFRSPYAFSSYTSAPRACHFCGQARPGYGGPFIGEADIAHICEPCLAAGRLAEANAAANDGDWDALYQQLEDIEYRLHDEEIQALAEPRRAELEQRTPPLSAWQDWLWPAHCGDYCEYIKEAGQPDLLAVAPLEAQAALFGRRDDPAFREWWSGIRLDSPQDNAAPSSPAVYLFQCLVCGQHLVEWDAD